MRERLADARCDAAREMQYRLHGTQLIDVIRLRFRL
jgi:hypothetical protein